PARLPQLALLHDHRVEGRHLGVLVAAVSLDDDALALFDLDPARVAEDDPAVLVLVQPDADEVAPRIERVPDRAAPTARHGSWKTYHGWGPGSRGSSAFELAPHPVDQRLGLRLGEAAGARKFRRVGRQVDRGRRDDVLADGGDGLRGVPA